jgi:hypothetical protein
MRYTSTHTPRTAPRLSMLLRSAHAPASAAHSSPRPAARPFLHRPQSLLGAFLLLFNALVLAWFVW